MSPAITGGCLCGTIRYEYKSEVGPASYCHCTDCRKCTGSAFNVGVRVDAKLFRIVQGSPKEFNKAADSGNYLSRHFCSDCGSPLYTSSPRHPESLYVKAGSFDDPAVVRPAYQSWLSSKVPWAVIRADLPGFLKGRI
ncbi:MAG: GFA family protein [Alphaproteobacteria bacterium]|nr:GFA family protein [Alphaproteobacteria bacterium]